MTGDGSERTELEATALAMAVARLARLATGDFVVDEMLGELCTAAAEILDVAGVGVMSVDMDRSRFVRASHLRLQPLERWQEHRQEGPCRDAADTGRPAHGASTHEIASCWGDFADITAAHGIQSVLAVPLMSRGRCWGTLDLYWDDPHEPTAGEHATAQLLADVAVSYLVMATDRAAAASTHASMVRRVLHDELTGLPNRELLHELIQHALAVAARNHTIVAVLFIDLDRFKAVNDTHGHQAGDLVLQEVARRLRATVRAGDSVGRLSGDEFLVVCEGLPSTPPSATAAIRNLAGKAAAAVRAPLQLGPQTTLTITASIGTASSDAATTALTLIHQADLAMYRVKHSRAEPPPV